MKFKFIHTYFIPLVIIFVFIILGVSFYAACNKTEGFTMPAVPGTMYNSYEIKAKPMSSSDLVTVMTEIFTDIQNNDTKLHVLDSSYNLNTFNLVQDDFQKNINSMLNVMKLQDVEIKKRLSTYIPSPDLSKLINGTLLAVKAERLYNLSRYPISPSECSIDYMTEQKNRLSKKLTDALAAQGPAANPPPVVDPNIQVKMLIANKEDDIVELKQNLKDPNFTKCNPNMSTTDADSIYIGLELNAMTKIVALQTNAVNTIQTNVSSDIVNSYSTLGSTKK